MEIYDLDTEPMHPHQATGIVYQEKIEQILSDLNNSFSVLVVCDKRIVPYIQGNLVERMSMKGLEPVSLIQSNQILNMDIMRSAESSNMLKELSGFSDKQRVVMLPHLDLLTTVEEGFLSQHTRDVILQALYINEMGACLLGFRDPGLNIPPVMERFFDSVVQIDTMNPDKFLSVISQSQARCFNRDLIEDSLQMQIFQAISGLNVVEFLKLVNHIETHSGELPYEEDEQKEHLQKIFYDIRKYTARGQAKTIIPSDVRIGGYHDVQQRIHDELIKLIKMRRKSKDKNVIKRIDQIIPRGIMFEGPPGTGKTYFARWIASEIQATLYLVNGPELKSKWFGESEHRVREIFLKARKTAPSLIVFDEFDSLAGMRGSGRSSSEATDSIVNQLLTEMDGFQEGELCLVVATTNRLDMIDHAFLRPGRFEFVYHIDYPKTLQDRKEILQIYIDEFDIPLDASLLDRLVSATEKPGINRSFSCDELKGICRKLSRKILLTEKTLDEKLIDETIFEFSEERITLYRQNPIDIEP